MAALVPLWPRGSLEIATTNYDFLLEQAIQAVFTYRAEQRLPAFEADQADSTAVTGAVPVRVGRRLTTPGRSAFATCMELGAEEG